MGRIEDGEKVFIIDVNACVGCHNCFIACKDEFVDHAWLPYSEGQPDSGPSWISVQERERGQFPKVKTCYIPQLCMQCEHPPCVKAARMVQCSKGRTDSDHRPKKSKDRDRSLRHAPTEYLLERGIRHTQKCTFCAHLLDQGWKEPRCVEVCPTQALRFGEKAEFSDVIAHLPAYGERL